MTSQTEVLSAGGRTRIIANFGVGVNHIDLSAARAQGIAVTNTPDVLSECTADLAMALLLMSARRAGEGERELRAGQWIGWRPTHLIGTRVWGKTLGIVGMGRIGIATARRAHHGFGMRILCFNRSPVPKMVLRNLGAEQLDSLDELLPQVDFLSLHCPANPESHHLIDAAGLAQMRPTAHLVNTARGSIVDEAALAEALNQGVIAGAGLDVYEAEPKGPPCASHPEQRRAPPPHGQRHRRHPRSDGQRVLDNLKAFFAGNPPPDLCN